jgi:hypothetical protein
MRTPVIFLIFNRPDHTRRVFAEIAKAKPPKLLIVADGPRPDRPGEAAKCAAAREVVERIDWDCEVLRNYSDANLGCGRRVASGIAWGFENAEEAVVLEDDTLPHPAFFQFCEALLERYKGDERVMHISGNNLDSGAKWNESSYYFSRYSHIWGWAAWRRSLRYYDFEMKSWPMLRNTSWLLDVLGDPVAAGWWRNYFDIASKGDRALYDSWDCQWIFSIWAQNGLAITPTVNLVSNIGFGAEATHTKGSGGFGDLLSAEITFPLTHPSLMIRTKEADDRAFEVACQPLRGPRRTSRFGWLSQRLAARLPDMLRPQRVAGVVKR